MRKITKSLIVAVIPISFLLISSCTTNKVGNTKETQMSTNQKEETQLQIEAMAKTFLYPQKVQPIVKRPDAYGLNFEEVNFKSEDSVNHVGWLLRKRSDKVVILSHPGAFTKYGYSVAHEGDVKTGYDKDVEFIPVAKHLVEADYTVLMYDNRNHGESDFSPRDGIHDPFEAHLDNVSAIEFIANNPEFKGASIGLLSFCQSSYISMVGMSERPEVYKENRVRAMVALQPISIEVFYRKTGMPQPVIDALKQVYLKNGIDMERQNPELFADKILVPTLFVQNVNDVWSDMDHIRRIYSLIPTEKKALWLDKKDQPHRFMAYNWFNDHPEELLAFFEKHL